MRISVVSNTGIPAVLPEDENHWSNYGSESQNAVLVKALADKGHQIEWYAPIGSTTFPHHQNVNFHRIVDSKGQHLSDERLEAISGAKTSDILNTDFLIDASKQSHVSEELEMWYNWKKSAQYRSGYKDWTFPMRIKPRHVTHCKYFQEFFGENLYPAEVARFGLSDFWGSMDSIKDREVYQDLGEYFLYPHRPNIEKGAQTVVKLAQEFKQYKFVIQTGLKFDDHFREWNAFKESCKGMENVVFIELPQNNLYQRYRRSIMRNALAILSLFSEFNGYMDTGGIVTAEGIRCGTPTLLTRSQGSQELFGNLEDKGVTFCDGFESARMAIKFKSFETRPNVGKEFWSIDSYVEDWLKIIQKWSQ